MVVQCEISTLNESLNDGQTFTLREREGECYRKRDLPNGTLKCLRDHT